MKDKDLEDPADTVPIVSQELIDLVDDRFPVTLPTPTGTERSDLYAAGQREVVDFLIGIRKYQLERARERGIIQ